MWWWKQNSLLKKQIQDLQSELSTEQGKASRLAGFLSRLQSPGNSGDGKFSERAFGESVVDAMHGLLHADQILFLTLDNQNFDFVPLAARGFAPQVLSTLRARQAEDLKSVIPSGLVQSLASHERLLGFLAIARSTSAFSNEEKTVFTLLAHQTSVLLGRETLRRDLESTRRQTVEALTRALGAKDAYTHQHARRTRMLVRAFAQELSLPDVLIEQMEEGALLHDVGKIGIDDTVLKKPGALSPPETQLMQTHATLGRHIIEPVASLYAVGAIVLYHQEWYNGSGYPQGLAGEEIPLGARVVQILDAWGAMTSDRPYRKAMTRAQAVAELRRQAGTQFDPKLVEVFLRVIERLEREGISTTDSATTNPLASRK